MNNNSSNLQISEILMAADWGSQSDSEFQTKIQGQIPEKIELLNKTLLGAETYRLFFKDGTAILRLGLSPLEYNYTVKFTKCFLKHGVAVARIFAEIPDYFSLIIEDLGSQSLMDLIQSFHSDREHQAHKARVLQLYKSSLQQLLKVQFEVGPDLVKEFATSLIVYDQQMIIEDLAYFSQYYLNKKQIDYNLTEYEDDLKKLANLLKNEQHQYFYYRDCMARNIMIYQSKPYFIDYVGGREGYIGCLVAGLEESVVTLIQHPRANLSIEQRDLLLQFYLQELKKYSSYSSEEFLNRFKYYTIVKYLQILGTYGKLSNSAGDDKFAKQGPAVLQRLHEHVALFDQNEFPELFAIISELVAGSIV